jgi:thiol-disulfide isomerase/thioredoxin
VVASSVGSESACDSFSAQEVGSSSYLNRHNSQMFTDGRSFSGNERNKLFLSRGDETFLDVSALSATDSPGDGRAVLAADFDDDGDVDLFVHNLQRERHSLYRNDFAVGGFLKLRLTGTSGNPEGVGATVIVHGPHGPVAQVLSRGDGYSSCQVPELTFGLGRANEAEVVVHWPGGSTESFGELEAGTRAVLVEGTGAARAFDAHPNRLADPLPLGLKLGIGQTVADFRAVDADGKAVVVSPRELAGGKRLYLNFWASYCGPCVAELPLLQELDAADEQVVIAVSADAPADREKAHRLFESRGASFGAYYLSAESAEDAELGTVADLVDLLRLPIPTTLVLSPEGEILEIIRGPIATD